MPSDVTVKIRVPQYLEKYIAAQSLNKSEPLVFHHKHVNAISLVQKVSNFNTLKQIPLSERENVREHFSPHIPRSGNIIIQLPWSRDKDVRRLTHIAGIKP